jgi:hypothetical protein
MPPRKAAARKLAVVRENTEALDLLGTVLEDYPEHYLACRGDFHPWEKTSDYRLVDARNEGRASIKGNSSFVERKWTCTNCGMVRSDYFAVVTVRRRVLLRKIGGYYQQPEGYPIRGIGSPSGAKEYIRGAQYARLLRGGDS